MSKSEVATWTSFCECLKGKVSPASYKAWFSELELHTWNTTKLNLTAPNRYVKQWLENHYQRELMFAAREIKPSTQEIFLLIKNRRKISTSKSRVVGDVLDEVVKDTQFSEPSELVEGEQFKTSASSHATSSQKFSGVFRPDSFVIDASNKLVYTACKSIVERPAAEYNPLVICSERGLGKSHLLHTLGRTLNEKYPGRKILQVSGEEFANEFIRKTQAKRLDEFRAEYRKCSALLVDDLHFIAGKEKTQQEFLHTFDTLWKLGRQIVVTSNALPREIKKLNENLVERLQAGLVARINQPGYEMRVRLVNAKARERGIKWSQDIADILATRMDSSIRELEGAVCKLAALSAAEGRAPDRDMVYLALRELGYLREGPLQLEEILVAVCKRYNQSADEIRSGKRHTALVRSRHIAMYLTKMLTTFSMSEVGRFYGNRDHSTVLHAIRKLEKAVTEDPFLKSEIEALQQFLGR